LGGLPRIEIVDLDNWEASEKAVRAFKVERRKELQRKERADLLDGEKGTVTIGACRELSGVV